MTTVSYNPALEPRESYINIAYTVKSWLFTVDHKRIGILYLIAITAFFFIGLMFLTVWSFADFPPFVTR